VDLRNIDCNVRRRWMRMWPLSIYVHRELRYDGIARAGQTVPSAAAFCRGYHGCFRAGLSISAERRELPADGTVPSLPDWKWYHTPAHSAGHVSLPIERSHAHRG
jgi:glyoxylase-like metal-dependent hydrolase (beta-lactamase superfamily II)